MTTPQEAHAWAITIEDECTQVFLNKQDCEMEFQRLNNLYPESTRRMICLAEKTAQQPQALSNRGWKEAAIAWNVCASIHMAFAKGKDALFKTRQQDFIKHAEDARAVLSAAHSPSDSPKHSIQLSLAEIQSGLDRVRWAEGLIRQLPEDHEGRNAWLLNYGNDSPAQPSAESDRRQSLHEWFGLSYAQFLTLPRAVIQEMPDDWQGRMVSLLEELDETFDWLPANGKQYFVRVAHPIEWPYEDRDGNSIEPILEKPDSDLCNYRHPDLKHRLIAQSKQGGE